MMSQHVPTHQYIANRSAHMLMCGSGNRKLSGPHARVIEQGWFVSYSDPGGASVAACALLTVAQRVRC